jgi:hypothetical protein
MKIAINSVSLGLREWLFLLHRKDAVPTLYSSAVFTTPSHSLSQQYGTAICPLFPISMSYSGKQIVLGTPPPPTSRKLRTLTNILRVLSGTSWGWRYNSHAPLVPCDHPLQNQFGSHIYRSASQTKLSIIDSIHNTGIRLATGAFRTSRLESRFAEAGEPLLSPRRNLLQRSQAELTTKSPILHCGVPTHPSP